MPPDWLPPQQLARLRQGAARLWQLALPPSHSDAEGAAAEDAAEPPPTLTLPLTERHVVEVYLGHYIEDLAGQVVGVRNVPEFMQQCVALSVG